MIKFTNMKMYLNGRHKYLADIFCSVNSQIWNSFSHKYVQFTDIKIFRYMYINCVLADIYAYINISYLRVRKKHTEVFAYIKYFII